MLRGSDEGGELFVVENVSFSFDAVSLCAAAATIKLIEIYCSYFLLSSLSLTQGKTAINFPRCHRKPTNNFTFAALSSPLKRQILAFFVLRISWLHKPKYHGLQKRRTELYVVTLTWEALCGNFDVGSFMW